MSANKNVSVCVATRPRLLIELDANRPGQKATGLPAEQRKHHTTAAGCGTRVHNAADQRATARYAAGRADLAQ
jgi:hypothetical protein